MGDAADRPWQHVHAKEHTLWVFSSYLILTAAQYVEYNSGRASSIDLLRSHEDIFVPAARQRASPTIYIHTRERHTQEFYF